MKKAKGEVEEKASSLDDVESGKKVVGKSEYRGKKAEAERDENKRNDGRLFRG